MVRDGGDRVSKALGAMKRKLALAGALIRVRSRLVAEVARPAANADGVERATLERQIVRVTGDPS